VGTFWRLVGEVRRQKGLLAITVITSVIGQAAMIGVPIIVRRMVDMVLEQGRTDRLAAMSIAILGLALVRGGFGLAETVLGVRFGQLVMRDMRQAVYGNLLRLSFSYFDRTRTGELMSRITNDLEPIGGFLTFYSRVILRAAVMFVGVLVACLMIEPRLALASLLPMPMLALSAVFLGQRIRPAFERARELLAEVTSRLQESIGAIIVVKAYCRENREIARFDEDSAALRQANYNAEAIDALYFPLTGFWASLSTLAVLWYGGWLCTRGELSVGSLVAFNIYVGLLIMPVRMLGWGVSGGMRGVAAARRLYAIQDELPDLTPAADPTPLGRLAGDIRFEGVAFTYNGRETVLDGIDLHVRPGEVLGVLGGVGSGKSTLAALVPRFYDPTGGRVLVDGVDVREVDPAVLRSQIGVVFQESFLFSGTIRENVAFGRPEASEEEIRLALRRAALLDFIDGLEAGLETQVGERGMRLSGGQQQRMAIARALITDPRILILDSCTSSVDTYTEYLIQQALSELMAGRTTIVIAHRASSLAMADRVVVLDEGRIVQQGTPRELSLEPAGVFARLEALQRDLEGLEVAAQ
jgi:ABC-type multidrug transport system fused ATPase/permease subunit